MAAKPRITPGIPLRPWRQPWQVCFVPCWQHWTMKPWRMQPPFQHVYLLRPYESIHIGVSRWLYTEWSFMGCLTFMLDEHTVKPFHHRLLAEGAMLYWPGSSILPPPRMGNGLWPLTCVTYARQMLGLKFRFRIWTPLALWHELVDNGARVVIDPGDRGKLGYIIGRKDPGR
jgi:hypothetical protein